MDVSHATISHIILIHLSRQAESLGAQKTPQIRGKH